MKKTSTKWLIFIILVVGAVLVWQHFKTTEKNVEEKTEQEQETKTDVFDQQIVWWDNEALEKLHECIEAEIECVQPIMESYGAGSKAIEFYKETGWFATDFKEYGAVDLAYVLNPWRANSNEDYAMVNGNPYLITVEEELGIDNKNIKNYELLAQLHPEYSIWGTDTGFVEKESNNFVFKADIKDERGCHACSSGYTALVSFEFDEQGNYQGIELKSIYKEE